MNLAFNQRAKECDNAVAKRLFSIMHDKQTMLSLSADLTKSKDILKFADLLGPKICLLKTHIDIVDDFAPEFTAQLRTLADKHNFLIFEDRKFADIGNTVKHQYGDGIYRIAEWADIVNAHTLPGPGIIEGLKAVGLPKGRALLLLAQMSSRDNLFDEEYSQDTVSMAKEHSDFVIGFIAQQRLLKDPSFIHMTPGVKLTDGTDKLGQQYQTPETVVKLGADIIIVGRGILQANDPVATAEEYRAQAWAAYQETLS